MMQRAFCFVFFLSVYSAFGQDVMSKSAADSLPAFSKDSSKTAAIRALEAGRSRPDHHFERIPQPIEAGAEEEPL